MFIVFRHSLPREKNILRTACREKQPEILHKSEDSKNAHRQKKRVSLFTACFRIFRLVRREEVKNASITVSKTVAGIMGDKTKDFTFQLKMTGNTPAEIPYTKGTETGTLKATDGVAEFTLSHGENIVLSEIPIGTTYEITEVDGASNGYTVESTNSSGTLTEDTNVSFTNTRNGTVPTAVHTNILIFIGVFAIALAGLFWYLRKRKQ